MKFKAFFILIMSIFLISPFVFAENDENLQTAGFANITHGKSIGMQLTTGVNGVDTEFTGPQISGVGNFIGTSLTGFQVTGGVNLVDKFNIPSFQIAGLGNFADDLAGLQLTGGINCNDNDHQTSVNA